MGKIEDAMQTQVTTHARPRPHASFVMPPPSLNGGLYTGQPFAEGAPWRNFPALPDSGFLLNTALQSAHPPPGAQYHVPGGGLRPGNNTPVLPRQMLASGRVQDLNLYCAPDWDGQDMTRDNAGFAGHHYIRAGE
jgi:hypothetical protein